MPKKSTRKSTRKTTKRKSSSRVTAKKSIMSNQFFGMLLIAVGVGALIVFLRYLIITWVMPADVYLVEPALLVPGMK